MSKSRRGSEREKNEYELRQDTKDKQGKAKGKDNMRINRVYIYRCQAKWKPSTNGACFVNSFLMIMIPHFHQMMNFIVSFHNATLIATTLGTLFRGSCPCSMSTGLASSILHGVHSNSFRVPRFERHMFRASTHSVASLEHSHPVGDGWIEHLKVSEIR